MLAIFGDGELGGSKWGWIISGNPQEIGVNILLECVFESKMFQGLLDNASRMFQALLSIPAKRMNTPRSWYHEA
jgi:hypothetical protein